MTPENVSLYFMLGCCGIIVIPFSILIAVLIARGRKQSWVGTVISKSYTEKEEDDNPGKKQKMYAVRIKLENGEEHNLAVDHDRYNLWKEGDKLRKESGKTWPEKVG